jgi:DNA-binding CsgD family transcriptional regulator
VSAAGPAGPTGPEREEARRMFAVLRRADAGADPALRAYLADLAARILALVGRPAPGAPGLTAREIDVLAHAALGSRNREVAAELGLSTETVKSYLRSAMAKLGVHSRQAAAERAREVGAIP